MGSTMRSDEPIFETPQQLCHYVLARLGHEIHEDGIGFRVLGSYLPVRDTSWFQCRDAIGNVFVIGAKHAETGYSLRSLHYGVPESPATSLTAA